MEENGSRKSDESGSLNNVIRTGARRMLEIDGSNLILCPGFIDLHAHSDLHLPSDPSHVPKVSQGIKLGHDGIGYSPLVGIEYNDNGISGAATRVLMGEKALGYARRPITGWNGNPQEAPLHWEEYRQAISSPEVDSGLPNDNTLKDGQRASTPFFTWFSTAEYLDTLDAHHLAVNAAVLVPQGNPRLLVLGPDPPITSFITAAGANIPQSTSASQEEITEIKAMLRRGLDFFFSSGLLC
jgi:N-acyl-D-amino-acid deacylase